MARFSGLARNLPVDVALPWLAVQVLERAWHVPTVSAFAAAAVFPAVSVVLVWARDRRADMIGIFVLVTLVGGVATALLTDDVRFAVVKGAPGFALFGLACLLSIGRARPLMFFVARQFTAAGDAAKAAAFTARLENPGFRATMRHLTLVWGLAALAEAVLGVVVALRLPPEAALVVEPILAFGTVGGLLAWTLSYARRRAAPGRAPQGLPRLSGKMS